MKKLTTIMLGLLCGAVMSAQAEPFSTAFSIDTMSGTLGTNVTLTSETLIGPDGLATFNVTYDISAFPVGDGKGTNIVAFNTDQWGIDDNGQIGPGEAAMVSNPAVTNFNANGGNLLESDIKDLSLKRLFISGGQGNLDSGNVTANGITGTWTKITTGIPQFDGHVASATIDLHVMMASNSLPENVQSFEVAGLGGNWRMNVVTVAGNFEPSHSSLAVDPSSLSLILEDPDTATNGVLNANFLTGTLSNDVEILSTVTDLADFSVVLSGSSLSAGNPTETITVTYTNSGDLVNNGDSTNATLSVEWTEVGSSVTNITAVPLDVLFSKFALVGPVIDRPMSTPNDRLRVAFQHAGADSIELAVRNAADTKLEFTAYDGHAAAEVRAIYTTKTGVPSAVTNQASDFTDSGFFSYITEPFALDIPVDNSGDASNVVELVDLVNTAWTWKDNVDETVVFIDLASISEISNLVSDVDLTIELRGKSGASTLVSEVDVTITPDGTVSYTFVANGASFANTNGIELGSSAGGSGNRFTGNNRHVLAGPGLDQDQVASAGGGLNDKVFGMFFDTDSSGFLLDNILINLSGDSTSVLPAGGGLLKLELWKINAALGGLSTTNVATTFPDPELVFTGTGNFSGSYSDDDLYMIDLPGITLDADTRYGWSLRWNTTEPANLVIGVDRGPANVGGSFDGNHLRLNRSDEMFPFYGVTDDEGAGAWDIVFFLRSGGTNSFAAWAAGFGLMGADALPTADPENGGLGDGYVNLMEYALGMDPTIADAGSKESINRVVEGSTNYFEYVHDRRSDYVVQNLIYNVIDNEDLISPASTLATNSQDEVTVGAAIGDYEAVTNRYIVDRPAQFFQLEVRQE